MGFGWKIAKDQNRQEPYNDPQKNLPFYLHIVFSISTLASSHSRLV
jgi:hypothetical protein